MLDTLVLILLPYGSWPIITDGYLVYYRLDLTVKEKSSS